MTRRKGTGGLAKELNKVEIDRISKCLAGTRFELRNRSLFYLCLGSGMRVGESSQLLIKDVMPNGEILKEIALEKHSTKGKRSRTVYLSSQAHGHLTAYLDSRGGLTPDAPLFPTQKTKHKAMSANVAAQIIGKIMRDAGVENASSHSCRRSFANKMRREVPNTDVFLIKELLGHQSLATTQKYFVLDNERAKDTVAKLKF